MQFLRNSTIKNMDSNIDTSIYVHVFVEKLYDRNVFE